jgi:hypothetical protein
MCRRLAARSLMPLLMLPLFGCMQELTPLHESDMPRISSTSSLSQDVSSQERFNARALWDDFANVVQADLDCKGRVLHVTGIVRIVAKDDRSRSYIGFQVFEPIQVPASRLRSMSAKEKMWFQDGYPPLVICYLASAERTDLPQISKGQTVQVVGRCLGRVKDPSGFKEYMVVLDCCRIQSPGAGRETASGDGPRPSGL